MDYNLYNKYYMTEKQDPLMEYLNTPQENNFINLDNNSNNVGNLKQKVDESVLNPTSSLTEYLEAPLDKLPMGKFYKPGTHISIRPAKVVEIQAFSTMDEANPYDRNVKMTELLKSTVRITFADGSVGTYEDIFSFDKLALIIFVSRYTKQKAKALNEKTVCTCGLENTIFLTPENFEFFESDEILDQFFDLSIGGYKITLENGIVIKMIPPTVRLEDSLYTYTLKKAASKKEKPNVAFLQAGAWLAPKQIMKDNDWDQLLFEFTHMQEDVWDVVDDVIKKGKYGISGIKKKCSCGLEVRTDFTFPGGVRGLFTTTGALQKLIKK